MQQEVELSRQRHDGDLKEKNRLSRMLDHKVSILALEVHMVLVTEIKLFLVPAKMLLDVCRDLFDLPK